MEVGPQNQTKDGLLGPNGYSNSIIVGYMDPLGYRTSKNVKHWSRKSELQAVNPKALDPKQRLRDQRRAEKVPDTDLAKGWFLLFVFLGTFGFGIWAFGA